MWPLLGKGIVVFTALAFFLSSVFVSLNTDHPAVWTLQFCFNIIIIIIITVVVILKRGCPFYVSRKMMQSSGWMSTAYCLALCVYIEYTWKTREVCLFTVQGAYLFL